MAYSYLDKFALLSGTYMSHSEKTNRLLYINSETDIGVGYAKE